MDFSVVIPARNAEHTLGRCLEAVFTSSSAPSEVLVVDDGSADRTAAIAETYGCRILKIFSASGPMEPRFAGARAARFPLLVFVDADVVVRRDTFAKIVRRFSDPSLHALTGLLSDGNRSGSFFSDYKNHYMRHVFLGRPAESSFLYGSLWAVRRGYMVYFRPITKPFGSLVSDSETGFRLCRRGKRILLDHTIEVDHLKHYTLGSLLKNDFQIPFLFSLMFVRYGGFRRVLRGKAFSHASLGQTAAVTCAFLALVSAVAAVIFSSFFFAWTALGLAVSFYAYWAGFFLRLRPRGFFFGISAAAFKFLDANVMFCGMVSGFVFSLSGLWDRRGPVFR